MTQLYVSNIHLSPLPDLLPIPPSSYPLIITEPLAELPVLYSKFSPAIYFKHGSVCMTDEWIRRYDTYIQWNVTLSLKGMKQALCRDMDGLESVKQSEVSQKKKSKYRMYVELRKMMQMNLCWGYFSEFPRRRRREWTFGHRVGRGEWDDWEIRTSVTFQACILLGHTLTLWMTYSLAALLQVFAATRKFPKWHSEQLSTLWYQISLCYCLVTPSYYYRETVIQDSPEVYLLTMTTQGMLLLSWVRRTLRERRKDSPPLRKVLLQGCGLNLVAESLLFSFRFSSEQNIQLHSDCSPWAYCDPMDCSPPGSCVHGILQTRIRD